MFGFCSALVAVVYVLSIPIVDYVENRLLVFGFFLFTFLIEFDNLTKSLNNLFKQNKINKFHFELFGNLCYLTQNENFLHNDMMFVKHSRLLMALLCLLLITYNNEVLKRLNHCIDISNRQTVSFSKF